MKKELYRLMKRIRIENAYHYESNHILNCFNTCIDAYFWFVNIYIIATEAHDDDGLPHTLEHLIFLGSEKYPFKGVLDLLANRCLASGTNAWTDTDHTCYTMTTAGKDGFLELLPIYLDHVLYPTLSVRAPRTEKENRLQFQIISIFFRTPVSSPRCIMCPVTARTAASSTAKCRDARIRPNRWPITT